MKLQKALIGGLNNRPVREWIIGDQYCLVNSTRWGLAANPQDRPLTKFEDHHKFESKELASLLLNEDTGKACLGMAAVNSDMKIDSRLKEISVSCYSGYKANERPVSFTFREHKLTIERIVDRWYGTGGDNFFKILAGDKKFYLLKYNQDNDLWSMEKVYGCKQDEWHPD